MSIVTAEVFKTTQELMQARAQHMDNLNLLRTASKHWDDKTAQRGEATMANLMQQVYALDAELQMAGSRKGAAA